MQEIILTILFIVITLVFIIIIIKEKFGRTVITLANLSKATAQEVFDQGAIHLLTQNEKCMEDDLCKYRSGKLKCAGGCFISDEEYSTFFEGNDWERLVKREEAPEEHGELIKGLQLIHDTGAVEKWYDQLIYLAGIHNLNIKAIKKFKK